jgi:hypothetical protein
VSVSPKQILKAFLMAACLVWILDKLYRAYTEGSILGRRRIYTRAEEPLSFDVYFALHAVFALVIAGMIVTAVSRGKVDL